MKKIKPREEARAARRKIIKDVTVTTIFVLIAMIFLTGGAK